MPSKFLANRRRRSIVKRSAGFIGRDLDSLLQEDVAGVQPFVHVHDTDSCLAIAGDDRGLDRCRAAMPRQQRSVKVQAGDRWNLENRARQNLPIRHHDDHFGLERPDFFNRLFDSFRLQDLQLACG